MSEEQLKKYAIKASDVRRIINMEVDHLKAFQPQPPEADPDVRTRKGIKHSTAKQNSDGLMEKEIRNRIREETPVL